MKQWEYFERMVVKAKSGRVEKGEIGRKDQFNYAEAEKASNFHRSFPGYSPTPLVALDGLAKTIGAAGVYVKDENHRFGLHAFKALGGSYCIGNYIAKKLGMDIQDLTYEKMVSPEVREKLGSLTFITATDGNHGRGVAWGAKLLGQKCVVLMPKFSSEDRLYKIRLLGADAWITDVNYDDTVRMAQKMADENGWVLVQDTAWDGYEEIPGWIMQGYMTMGHEIVEQLGGIRPTHIFLQAGVGAMAGAMTGFFADYYDGKEGEKDPVIVIVEPDKADCIFKTAEANDGKLHKVEGDLDSIMAGLCCGEVCPIGWDVLKTRADHFISITDYFAMNGMRLLSDLEDDDAYITSGESGAATIGLVQPVMMYEAFAELKEILGLDENSRILCISTEGATDEEMYWKIVGGE